MSVSIVNRSCGNEHFPEINSLRPWLVCFTAALFFFYEFIQLNMFNAIHQGITRSFSINAAQLGSLGSASLLANILFLFPAGLLLDRFSTRKLILLTLSLCVAATYGFSLVKSFEYAWLLRFLAGVGSAFCFLSSIRLASRWFPARHMALVTGLIVTVAMLGGLAAQTPLALLEQHYGWRVAVQCDAALGVVFIVLIACIVRDYPPGHSQHHDKNNTIGLLPSLWFVLSKWQNIFAGVYTAVMNVPIMVLGAIWGSPYLQTVFHLNQTDATMVTSMVFIGTIIGSPTMGWLSDLFGRRRLLMLIGALLSLLLVLFLFQVRAGAFQALMLCFLFLGFFSSTQVLAYPIVAESNPITLTATALSVISFIVQGGGAWLQSLFGWLLVQGWQGQYQAGVPFYSAVNYQHAVLMLPCGFIIAIIVAGLIHDPA